MGKSEEGEQSTESNNDANHEKDKKKPVFRPKQTPRYLIGSETKTVIARDLVEYNKHRYKVSI